MRKIKFRGKRIDNGEWIYGDLLHGSYIQDGSTWIRYFDEKHQCYYSAKVHPESVGQYTGLIDKNGKEIYEGDIVEAWSEGSHANFEVRWRQEALPCWILYPNGKFNQLWKLHGSKHVSGEYHDTVEVLGNIYDNTELLK